MAIADHEREDNINSFFKKTNYNKCDPKNDVDDEISAQKFKEYCDE